MDGDELPRNRNYSLDSHWCWPGPCPPFRWLLRRGPAGAWPGDTPRFLQVQADSVWVDAPLPHAAFSLLQLLRH